MTKKKQDYFKPELEFQSRKLAKKSKKKKKKKISKKFEFKAKTGAKMTKDKTILSQKWTKHRDKIKKNNQN